MRGNISDVESTMDVKNGKYKNPGKIAWRENVGRLISESAFVVLDYVIWLIRKIV